MGLSLDALKADALMIIVDTPGAIPVVYNGVTSFGTLDVTSDFEDQGNGVLVQNRRTTLTVVNGVFNSLRVNARIVAGGDTYIIREFDPRGIDDGVLLPIVVTVEP